MKRKAFTMLELIFVIVVIGIIAKFGVEFLIQAYDGYIFSTVQNRLQSQTEIALEQVTNRLQYRIKSSVIVRDNNGTFNNNFRSLLNANDRPEETILEWVGYDIDGIRGDWNGTMNVPTWSGFIDLDNNNSSTSRLVSLGTDTTNMNTMIGTLSYGLNSVNNGAIFFTGANTNIDGYGWGGAINDQNQTMHPIQTSTSVDYLASNVATGDFAGHDIYEFYKFSWTAYALVYTGAISSNAIEYINRLDAGGTPPTLFDTNGSVPIMSTSIPNVTGTRKNGDWTKTAANTYVVRVHNEDITFTYDRDTGSFDCVVNATKAGRICERLRN